YSGRFITEVARSLTLSKWRPLYREELVLCSPGREKSIMRREKKSTYRLDLPRISHKPLKNVGWSTSSSTTPNKSFGTAMPRPGGSFPESLQLWGYLIVLGRSGSFSTTVFRLKSALERGR